MCFIRRGPRLTSIRKWQVTDLCFMHLMHLLKKIWESKFVATYWPNAPYWGKKSLFLYVFSAQPFLTCSKSFVSRRLGDWESSTGNETKIPILFKFYWKQNVLLANFISICFLCETLFAEWGFEVSWLHPILPPPHLGCFLDALASLKTMFKIKWLSKKRFQDFKTSEY